MNPTLIAKTNYRNSNSTVRVLALAAGAALIFVAGATTSCSTARGFGQDVEKTGDKIQHAATH